MKLNYVSVIKEYKEKNSDGCYFVRGELNGYPTIMWFKYFRLLWISFPAYRELCPEPQLSKNEILLKVKDGKDVTAVIDALRSVVSKMRYYYIFPAKSQPTELLDQEIV